MDDGIQGASERGHKPVDRSQLVRAMEAAEGVLESLGKRCNVSPDELIAWFETDTQYPDITLGEVLRSPWLVIHEIVEVDEVKRKGLTIAKNTILRNPAIVDEAHFTAAVVELRAAIDGKDSAYLRARIEDVRRWAKDPLVPPEMKKRYQSLAEETEHALITIENGE